MNTEDEIREKIDELSSRTRGPIENRDEIEFSELRDLLSAVKDQESERLNSDVEFKVLEDAWAKQIEGATTSDYISLIHEFGEIRHGFRSELVSLAASHVLVSEKDIDTEELLDAVEKNPEDRTVRTVMERVYRKDPGAFTGHTDRLFKSDDETLRDALIYISTEYPGELKEATPEFFEAFKRGKNRQIFCNFLAGLSRIDPNYTEEWAKKTFIEVTDEEIREDPEHEDMKPINECLGIIWRWSLSSTTVEVSEPLLKRIASAETTRWKNASQHETGLRFSTNFYLKPREFRDVREAAEENGDTFREAIQKGLKWYAEDQG
jgi:hypothetical protein